MLFNILHNTENVIKNFSQSVSQTLKKFLFHVQEAVDNSDASITRY